MCFAKTDLLVHIHLPREKLFEAVQLFAKVFFDHSKQRDLKVLETGLQRGELSSFLVGWIKVNQSLDCRVLVTYTLTVQAFYSIPLCTIIIQVAVQPWPQLQSSPTALLLCVAHGLKDTEEFYKEWVMVFRWRPWCLVLSLMNDAVNILDSQELWHGLCSVIPKVGLCHVITLV